MKRILSTLAVLAVSAAPLAAHAATFVSRNEYSRGPQERVSGDLYVCGGTVSLASDVSGDTVAAGGNISVSGDTADDVALAGGSIQLLGPVGDDARLMGGQLTIGNRVGGDLLAMGGNIHILQTSAIGGDVYVMGGHVVIDGTVQGAVHMMGGYLTINGSVGTIQAKLNTALVLGPDARVRGTLSYSSPMAADIDPSATVTGATTYEPTRRMHVSGVGAGAALLALIATLTAVKLLAYLGATALLMWRFRRWSLETLQTARDAFWPSAGRGLVYLILVPIGAGLLLMSIVGVFPGMLVLLAYASVAIVSKVLAGLLLGAWLAATIGKRQLLHLTWTNALGGTVLIHLLSAVPVLGFLVQVLLMLAVFGVLAHMVQRQVTTR